MRPGAALHLAVAATSMACSSRTMPSERFGLECLYDFRAPITECPRVAAQSSRALTSSEASELALRMVQATREGARLTLDIQLAGTFWNESDQNVYVFLGRAGAASYSLTADPSFASDLSYPVRSSLDLPHTNDVRIGVMSPAIRPYSPQLYVTDPVHSDAVGPSTGIVQTVQNRVLHLELPLDSAYAFAKAKVPERLSVTVATARDYVGFVDQLTVPDLAPSSTGTQTERALPPATYPKLDARSHRLERVAIRGQQGQTAVEVDTAAPIADWAQTNLYFVFVPVPPRKAAQPLLDPTHHRPLPHPWSYYCAVYSPRRVFCKASRGVDFTFDTAYSERATLPESKDVRFRETSPGKYVLDLGPAPSAELSDPKSTFGLIVATGRDGFEPTSFYGVSEPQ